MKTPVWIPLVLCTLSAPCLALDQNGNQQSDVWEMVFGAFGLPAAGDADGDGWTNAQESAAGTNPLDASSFPRLNLQSILSRHFLTRAVADGLSAKTLDHAAIAAMVAYRWPGNVRELENLMRRLAALCPDETISGPVILAELDASEPAETVPAPSVGGSEPLARAVERQIRSFLAAHEDGISPSDIYERIIAEVERPLILMTLAATRGNQIKAAAMLGLNRNTLRKKIRDLEIPVIRGLS